GHLPGKDGIYAASLLVEMAAVTNRPLLETYRELEAQFGRLYFEEEDFPLNAQSAKELSKLLFEEKALPKFGALIKSVSYLDGCKVTFANGGFAVVRFSGTEPLVRICAEMPKKREAQNCIDAFKTLMGL
ncbi:MAG TPA: phosphoglucomutase/phosphomannomutase family protein, partial [Clostridia bacterium]|nr:phosphoglucomutase/phosphomannomutase family protein [Clostridia bacterium]